ncbi:centrosomal protein of 164 kDa-like isoform X2 [Toxotes jaculatrix]|uniref:centrosomal protein of 164 kDa-like isoform X2 n=1 Tax=Toxotes jaculatrix TaxID=941984 RepID=UPI001B3AD50C|nr:centrosomal protein of 164 kDa-like isoform X2 [Toxotes jaculatrix]
MTAAALIGDQLILEEDYDENYIPSEQEIQEYAKEIGIDPDCEPELLWLAREGIVAPLPHEWKPCQDVTGDIYYFNFSTGQSTWDHPCDEHYRRLVAQERERTQLTAAAGGKGVKKDKDKKKKKEKKEKKEKKKKEPLMTPGALTSALGPLASPLGALGPLRGLDASVPGPLSGSAPALRGSLSSSGGLEPLKTPLGGPRSIGASSVLGSRQEERVSLTLPGFDDDESDDDKISENEPSPRGSDRLLKNLHLDLDALGGGLQYEDSEASGRALPEERTEPELQDLALSGDHSPEPPSQQDSLRGRHLHLSPLTSSRNHVSEEGGGPISPEPEHSAEHSEQEVAEELNELEEGDEEEGGELEDGDVYGEKQEDEGGGEAEEAGEEEKGEDRNEQEDGEEVDRKSKEEGDEMEEEQRESKASVESKKEEEEEVGSDEVEEECCEGEDEEEDEGDCGVTENMKRTEKQDSNEGEGDDSDERVERCIESQDDETEDRGESDEAVQSLMGEKDEVQKVGEEEEIEEDSDEVVEHCFKSDKDEGSEEEDKNDKDKEQERSIKDEEVQNESKEEEVEKNSKGMEEREKEEEDGESEEALERCSLSQRKLTDSDEEVLERCVRSEGEETVREGTDTEDESDAQKPPAASESEEEVVEVFKTGTAELGQKTMLSDLPQKGKTLADEMKSVTKKSLLPEEDSETSKSIEEASSSIDVKLSEKVRDINDLSGTVSPLEKDDREETREEEEIEERAKTKAAEATKSPMSEDKGDPLTHNVDRLVLHQSSPTPSLSSPSHSERGVELRPKTEGFGISLGLQRPETARGRLVRTLNTQLEDAELPLQNQDNSLDEEPSWRTLKDRGKKERQEEEERKTAEREEKSLRERKEEEREKRKVDQGVEEERKRLMGEKEKRMRLLQEELKREEEEEERKLKEESEQRLRALRQRLLSERREEEARLTEESDSMLEELRESVQREREKQQHKLREESEAMLKELRVTLEEERAAERDRLESQKRMDIEHLKAELEEELQAERRRIQGEKEETLNSLKQEVKSTERRRELMATPRPEQHLVEYRRELADVLQEVREEVQRDHERKLEQLREDHRREMNNIREKYLDEETAQRERLLSTLQEDRERLQASHAVQLEKLRLQLDMQIQKTQLTHSRKESELQDLADQLELRAKELKSQEAMLQTKVADLKRRRKKLGEEEEEVDRQIETLPRLIQERDQLKEELERMREEKHQARELIQRARQERSEAREEEGRLREERDKAREESRRVKEDKERLESKVTLLQERCDRLSCRVSELEQGEGASASPRQEPKQDKKTEEKTEVTAPSSDRRDSALHVEDLDDSPLSPVPDSQSSMDEFRRYISSHGTSIQKTKLFLERESSRLMERQAALQAAQTDSSQDPGHEGGVVTKEMMRNLLQEARNVAELQQTVQRGNSLLRRKEEQLQQLESSIAEEPLFEDLSRLAGERKVTFDVTESDLSSTADPPDGTGGHPTVPAKVQELAESLQQISGQLNTVLSALDSIAQRQSATPYTAFTLPLSQPHSTPAPTSATATSATATSTSVPVMPQMHTLGPSSLAPPAPVRLSEPSWSWAPLGSSAATPLYSSPLSSGLRASEDLINSRWSQIFPGAAMDPVTSSTMRTTSAYSPYTPVSEHSRSLRSMQKSVEVDGQRLQGLIDGNKRWLEMRKKDTSMYPSVTHTQPHTLTHKKVQYPHEERTRQCLVFNLISVPLFTRYRAPSSTSGLVQLGLDDNNQIRVYHY